MVSKVIAGNVARGLRGSARRQRRWFERQKREHVLTAGDVPVLFQSMVSPRGAVQRTSAVTSPATGTSTGGQQLSLAPVTKDFVQPEHEATGGNVYYSRYPRHQYLKAAALMAIAGAKANTTSASVNFAVDYHVRQGQWLEAVAVLKSSLRRSALAMRSRRAPAVSSQSSSHQYDPVRYDAGVLTKLLHILGQRRAPSGVVANIATSCIWRHDAAAPHAILESIAAAGTSSWRDASALLSFFVKYNFNSGSSVDRARAVIAAVSSCVTHGATAQVGHALRTTLPAAREAIQRGAKEASDKVIVQIVTELDVIALAGRCVVERYNSDPAYELLIEFNKTIGRRLASCSSRTQRVVVWAFAQLPEPQSAVEVLELSSLRKDKAAAADVVAALAVHASSIPTNTFDTELASLVESLLTSDVLDAALSQLVQQRQWAAAVLLAQSNRDRSVSLKEEGVVNVLRAYRSFGNWEGAIRFALDSWVVDGIRTPAAATLLVRACGTNWKEALRIAAAYPMKNDKSIAAALHVSVDCGAWEAALRYANAQHRSILNSRLVASIVVPVAAEHHNWGHLLAFLDAMPGQQRVAVWQVVRDVLFSAVVDGNDVMAAKLVLAWPATDTSFLLSALLVLEHYDNVCGFVRDDPTCVLHAETPAATAAVQRAALIAAGAVGDYSTMSSLLSSVGITDQTFAWACSGIAAGVRHGRIPPSEGASRVLQLLAQHERTTKNTSAVVGLEEVAWATAHQGLWLRGLQQHREKYPSMVAFALINAGKWDVAVRILQSRNESVDKARGVDVTAPLLVALHHGRLWLKAAAVFAEAAARGGIAPDVVHTAATSMAARFTTPASSRSARLRTFEEMQAAPWELALASCIRVPTTDGCVDALDEALDSGGWAAGLAVAARLPLRPPSSTLRRLQQIILQRTDRWRASIEVIKFFECGNDLAVTSPLVSVVTQSDCWRMAVAVLPWCGSSNYVALLGAVPRAQRWCTALGLLNTTGFGGHSSSTNTGGTSLNIVTLLDLVKVCVDSEHAPSVVVDVVVNISTTAKAIQLMLSMSSEGNASRLLRSGLWNVALRVVRDRLERGRHRGAEPETEDPLEEDSESLSSMLSVRSVSTALSARGSTQPVPNTGISATLLACLAANQWAHGVRLVQEAASGGIAPSIYSSQKLLTALRSGGQWDTALQLSEILQEAAVKQICIPAGGKNQQQQQQQHRAGNVSATHTLAGDLHSAVVRASWIEALKALVAIDRQNQTSVGSTMIGEVLRLCATRNIIAPCQRILALCEKRNIVPNAAAVTTTVAALSRAAHWRDVLSLIPRYYEKGLREVASPSTLNMAISACMRQGLWLQALKVFQSFDSYGFKPTLTAFKDVLKACIRSGFPAVDIQLLLKLHAPGGAEVVSVVNSPASIVDVRTQQLASPAMSQLFFVVLNAFSLQREQAGASVSSHSAQQQQPASLVKLPEVVEWVKALQLLDALNGSDKSVVTDDCMMLVMDICKRQHQWARVLQLAPLLSTGNYGPRRLTKAMLRIVLSCCWRLAAWTNALGILKQAPELDARLQNKLINCLCENSRWEEAAWIVAHSEPVNVDTYQFVQLLQTPNLPLPVFFDAIECLASMRFLPRPPTHAAGAAIMVRIELVINEYCTTHLVPLAQSLAANNESSGSSDSSMLLAQLVPLEQTEHWTVGRRLLAALRVQHDKLDRLQPAARAFVLVRDLLERGSSGMLRSYDLLVKQRVPPHHAVLPTVVRELRAAGRVEMAADLEEHFLFVLSSLPANGPDSVSGGSPVK